MESRIRELLIDRAEEAPALWEMPPRLESRVRRRTALMVGGSLVAIAVLVIGSVLAVRSLTSAERTIPTHPSPPKISPLPIPPPMHNGPFTLIGLVGGIRQLSPAGDPTTRLVKCDCTNTIGAAWTPDGGRIAFIAECDGGCGSAGNPYHGIRVLDVRRGTDQLIVPGDNFEALDWSPDGTRIAYATRPEGQVFVMTADGSGRRPLAGAVSGVTSLSWSPDGTAILYSTSGGQMFRYSFATAHSEALGSGRNPDWSPDGTRITYVDPTGCEIWVMAMDGGDPTRVADLTRPGSGECQASNGLVPASGPVWSPDGKELVVLAFDSLFVMRADGTHVRTISLTDPIVGITWRPVA